MNFKKYKLKDLIDNFSVRARDYGGSDGLEFLGVSNDDGIVKSKSAAEHKGEEYKIIEKGCFAYNPYRVNIGSIAYHNEDIKGLISPAYVIFKTKPNIIKDNLLFKFLKSAEGLRQIRFHGRGTVRQALRFEDLCKIEISLPSFEQQEILISNIEKTELESNLISSELNYQLDLIKQLRQAFLREAMQGKLVGSSELRVGSETGHELLAKIKTEKAKLIAEKKLKKEKELPPITENEIPFEIPKHWAWCRLGEICLKTTDGFHNTPPKVLKGFPYIAATQVKSDKIDWDNCNYVEEKYHRELYNKTTPKKGEILVVNIGAGCGTPAIIDVEFEFSFKNTAILKFNQNLVFNKYLFYYFILRKDEFYSNLTKGGLQPFLSLKILSEIDFPLPPFHEQEQIVAKLEELMSFCDGLEESIKESQGYNEKLLQEVLREALKGEKLVKS